MYITLAPISVYITLGPNSVLLRTPGLAGRDGIDAYIDRIR